MKESLKYAEARNHELSTQLAQEKLIDSNRTNFLNGLSQQLHQKTNTLNDYLNVTRTNKKTLEKEKDQLTNSHIDARRIKDKKQVSDYDYKKTEDQCSKIKEELNRAQYENRDLESRIDIFKRQEEELDQQLSLVHTTLNNQHHKHQRQIVERDDLRNKVCLHEAEGKDKRTEYDRTLDMCTELNHIIDSETHNRDVLYESVRALE